MLSRDLTRYKAEAMLWVKTWYFYCNITLLSNISVVTELLPPLVSATGQTLSCNDIKLSITITKSKYLKKKKRSLTLFAWCFVSFWGADK